MEFDGFTLMIMAIALAVLLPEIIALLPRRKKGEKDDD